jgi:hypothetical protein
MEDRFMKRSHLRLLGIALVSAFAVFTLFTAHPVFAQGSFGDAEVSVLPQTLERVSWAAILAGTIVALILNFAFNLLAVGIGASSLNPDEGDGMSEVASAGRNTAVAIALSAFGSLFLGGWMAARFSGMPERVDGTLHGLVVWGLMSIITLLFVTTTAGRLLSGVNTLVSRGLRLAADATGTVARGVGSVAQDAASRVGDAVQTGAQNVQSTAQRAIDQNPELQQLNQRRDSIMQSVQAEARQLMERAGVSQGALEGQVRAAGDDLRSAVQDIATRPSDASAILSSTLTRIFGRGSEVVGQVDRDELVHILMERGNLTEEQARQQVARWEQNFDQVRHQGEQVANQAKQNVERLGQEARAKIEDVKHEGERVAREAVQKTTDAIAAAALAAFVAIIVGGFAAGLGGALGAPQELPSAEVDTNPVVIPDVETTVVPLTVTPSP